MKKSKISKEVLDEVEFKTEYIKERMNRRDKKLVIAFGVITFLAGLAYLIYSFITIGKSTAGHTKISHAVVTTIALFLQANVIFGSVVRLISLALYNGRIKNSSLIEGEEKKIARLNWFKKFLKYAFICAAVLFVTSFVAKFIHPDVKLIV